MRLFPPPKRPQFPVFPPTAFTTFPMAAPPPFLLVVELGTFISPRESYPAADGLEAPGDLRLEAHQAGTYTLMLHPSSALPSHSACRPFSCQHPFSNRAGESTSYFFIVTESMLPFTSTLLLSHAEPRRIGVPFFLFLEAIPKYSSHDPSSCESYPALLLSPFSPCRAQQPFGCALAFCELLENTM